MSQKKNPPIDTKKRKKKNNYFTRAHQDAIVEYASTDDIKIRTELYITYIGPVFNEMVDKIVYTYKFTNLPNIDPLKEDCKVWLTTILDKFDPEKGSKAFSYFSVITKNWFIHKVKKNAKSIKREIYYDDIAPELEREHLTTENHYEEARETFEFWQHLWKEIGKWENLKLKDNERKVLDAVKILLNSVDDIEIFNKKAIYLYMREITGLNTKQIVNSLNKIRERYRAFKKEWQEGNV
jgi:DNA-directed RNA polymerase specialized sigma subunit